MKFAISNGLRIEASKRANGTCPSCNSLLVAKCGDVKVHHWAHKMKRNCDSWWESETEWHRAWKNNFPTDWQETHLFDEQTREKHIADVRTEHGLTIEFQHSHIDPKERTSRETFYKNMVWVVDGTRLKRDYPRFLKGKDEIGRTNQPGYFIVNFPGECFPASWLGSSVPVIFDFRGIEIVENSNNLKNNLYCLFPENRGKTILAVISRESFISNAISGELLKKHQAPPKPAVELPAKTTVRRREQSHYYDPRKGRFVKRRRF